jgi:hypothetical protein
LFENLVKEADSELFFHISHNLGSHPLDIVFKWILYAFVGVLDAEQVLLMWDRMIGFNSVDVIAVTAAALLTYRRRAVLAATDIKEAIVHYLTRMHLPNWAW